MSRDEFVQDPDGNWHLKPARRTIGIGARAAIIGVIAALVAGGFYWNWKQDQDRVGGETTGLTCQLTGDC